MTRRKKTVLGLILLLLAAVAVYSCIVVYGIRRKEPSRAKLVMVRELIRDEGCFHAFGTRRET